MLFLVCTIPFWTSNVIRMISWIPLLGRNGVVNQMLINAHVIDAPARAAVDRGIAGLDEEMIISEFAADEVAAARPRRPPHRPLPPLRPYPRDDDPPQDAGGGRAGGDGAGGVGGCTVNVGLARRVAPVGGSHCPRVPGEILQGAEICSISLGFVSLRIYPKIT